MKDFEKYLKYKSKYLKLKEIINNIQKNKQIGGILPLKNTFSNLKNNIFFNSFDFMLF
jgi:hypothetical protein